MRYIAIVVNDNDYGMVFIPLLEAVKNVLEWTSDEPEVPRDIIVQMIKEAVPFYVKHTLGAIGLEKNDISKYLLQKMRVLFDEDAENDIADPNAMRDGGAWYLNVETGVIDSY